MVFGMALMASCARGAIRPEGSAGSTRMEPATGLQEQKPGETPVSVSGKGTPEASAEYHFSLAQAYVAEGNPDRAIEEYKLVLAYDPSSALVYARLATEYIKKGSFSIAMEACKEALQRDPNYIDARLMLAGLLSSSRETDSALAEYDRILKKNPGHEEAVIYKSQLLVEEGRADEAVKDLHAFVKKSGDSPLGWYYLGKAEQKREKHQEAMKAFQKALDIRPGFSQAALALGYLYESRKQNTQAVEVYRGLYDQTQDLTAANRLATIYLKEEKYGLAVPYLEAIELTDPEDMNVRVKLGLIQMELKDYPQAITTFKGILLKNPESDRIHYYLGSLYEETKQSELAMKQLRNIKPDSKLFGDAMLHVAYLLKQENRVGEAKALIAESITQSPRIPGFYLFQASLAEEAKNVEVAVGVLEQATKIFPEDEKVRYYLGSLYDRQGHTDRSLEQMEAILRLNPENVDALNYVGYTWTVQGVRLNDAEKLLRRALVLKPNNGYIQDSWGWHLYMRGKTNEAIVQLEKAARLKPNESTILEHLADAYMKSNLREKAAKRYEEAVKFAEDDSARRKLSSKLETVRGELAHRGKRGTNPELTERMPASQKSSATSD